MALYMDSSSMRFPVTTIGNSRFRARNPAITSNTFLPAWFHTSTTSISRRVVISDGSRELSSKSDGEPKRVRKPTSRSGSLSATATRMRGFDGWVAFMNLLKLWACWARNSDPLGMEFLIEGPGCAGNSRSSHGASCQKTWRCGPAEPVLQSSAYAMTGMQSRCQSGHAASLKYGAKVDRDSRFQLGNVRVPENCLGTGLTGGSEAARFEAWKRLRTTRTLVTKGTLQM